MSDTTSEPRPQDNLSRLDAEQRETVLQFARRHSVRETLNWLAAGAPGRPSVATNTAALSAFLDNSDLWAHLDRHAAMVDQTLNAARQAHPDCSPDELHDAGQNFFSGLALAQADPRAWQITQRLMLRRDQLRLDLARFKREETTSFQEGLDAIAKALQGNPEASALFHQAVECLHPTPAQQDPADPADGESTDTTL